MNILRQVIANRKMVPSFRLLKELVPSMTVSSNLKNLDTGPQWRGYLDGMDANGRLRGWALVAADPFAELTLDLHVDGIHVATTFADKPHSIVDDLVQLRQPLNAKFEFDLRTFEPEGALELLRRHGRVTDATFSPDNIRVCIGGTRHFLPASKSSPDASINPEIARNAVMRAARHQLQLEVSNGLDLRQLTEIELDILLQTSSLFSPEWYAQTFGDVEMTGMDPTEHFKIFGSKLERPAGPWFDTEEYLAAAPKARASTIAKVTHYELHGHDTWWPGEKKFRPKLAKAPAERDHALLIHLYHLDTVLDLQRLVAQFPAETDIFVSIPENSPLHDPEAIAALFPRAKEILSVPNWGQDVSAFLETVRHLKGRGYRFFCKVHSKKGDKYPDTWRRVMFDALAAHPQRVSELIEFLRVDRRVLMAGPSQFWFDGPQFELSSADRLGGFMTKLGFGPGTLGRAYAFFAGTCFWIDAELAGLVAAVVTADQFVETSVSPDGQTAHAVERLFSLVAACAGGKFAVVDGRDWASPPVVLDPRTSAGLRMAEGEDANDFLERNLSALNSPSIVDGTALRPQEVVADDIFAGSDSTLHGAIDVIVSCWMGQREPMHDGFVHLQTSLADRGLTSAFMVANRQPKKWMQSQSCDNILLDSLMIVLPTHLVDDADASEGETVPESVALSLLRSECLFKKQDMLSGDNLADALRRVHRVAACWRKALIRHKIKLFLIWGNTAPKSRLFIHLCEELEIEYQIIERGHFPGTMSMDPAGQFGMGARPKLIEHVGTGRTGPAEMDARFDAIRDWYETQGDNAAYASFQKRGSRDVEIMRQARSQGRPVILAIGGNDQGGGVTGPDPDRRRLNWFGSSDNAFSVIRQLVSKNFPDALLVLRPHPSQAPQEGEFILVAREASLDDLIDNADLCITIATTASAICLLKEKPLLTLGLSELNGRKVGESIVDETHLLAALRRHVWTGFADPYPTAANRRHIVDLFDRHLIGVDARIPTRHGIPDLARLLSGRVQTMKTGFLQDYAGREDRISKAMFEDVRDRGRALFPVDPRAFDGRKRPRVSVVLPIYGDFEGTRVCFDQLARHRAENGYRVITVWDRGPDLRLRDLCLEYAEKAGFTHLENRENVGFSGTVNAGILHAGRDDVILLNSDTVPCGDWALRLQDAAYAHPKIASVVPFSNNATIYSLPFPDGSELPEATAVPWTERLDERARLTPASAVEMPISHGFCTYVRRSAFDRLGFYSETKFGKGHGEDNEFSMRIRAAGYFCCCATQVVVGHAGSTSFTADAMKWKLAGREAMRKEFSHYFNEVAAFFENDPLAADRRRITG